MAAKAGGTTSGGESQGLTALAQTIIGGKPVFLRGARITPAEVDAFVSQKRTQLRSNVFLITQLDADIDENAMAMLELKIACSRALENRPGPWRETWDVEYFLKALEEIYAVSEVDRFGESAAVWRSLLTKLEYSNVGALSLSFTAVLLETNNKHTRRIESWRSYPRYLCRRTILT